MSLFQGRPDLLQRFRDGDRQALETVYRTYVGRISEIVAHGFRITATGGSVPGLGSRPADLADAVQEIFLKAFSRGVRAAFDGSRDFGPYLSTIARNLLIDRARRNGRELLMPEVDLEVAGKTAASDAFWQVAARWEDPVALAVARRFVEGLPEDLACVHRLRYVEGLSQRDAAAHLGITRQTLRTLEEKLRAGLRRELRRKPAEESITAKSLEPAGSSPGLR